jgi:hypothetical protein
MDPSDVGLFCTAGLSIDDYGVLILHDVHDSLSVSSSSQQDDMLFRGIMLLCLKLVNFIAELAVLQGTPAPHRTP